MDEGTDSHHEKSPQEMVLPNSPISLPRSTSGDPDFPDFEFRDQVEELGWQVTLQKLALVMHEIFVSGVFLDKSMWAKEGIWF